MATAGESASVSPNEHLIGQPGSRWRLQTPALVLDLELSLIHI